MSQLQPDYINILNTLKEKIRQARIRASVVVNVELLKLYWEIGNTILERQKAEGWGAKIIDKLAIDLKTEFPDFTGLSVRNLKYMRAFAEAYPAFTVIVQPTAAQLQNPNSQDDKITQAGLVQIENTTQNVFVQPLFAQIPWSHHIVILEKVKSPEERLFYIEKTAQNGWSKAVLSLQIDSTLYQRQGKAITNFSEKLPALQSDLANETLKNPYIFDFLGFSEEIKERELEKALIQHLKKFMLELGKGFAYVGNQVNLNVAGKDYFLDLLFYNYHLRCFVVFELKVGDFEPEFAGKLNLYINAVDGQVKGKEDNPTIGVLLCKTPNETVVKYSLQGISTPMGIAEYQLAQVLPKELKGEIPSIEELEAEIEKEYEELKSPADKKMDRLKELIGGLKQPKLKEPNSPKTIAEIFDKVVLPIKDGLERALVEILKEFKDAEIMLWLDNQGFKTDEEATTHLKEHKEFNEFRIEIKLDGFIPAGTKAFYIRKDVCITTHKYYYNISLSKSHPQMILLPETLYHQLPDKKELNDIIERCRESIIDDITQQIEGRKLK